MAAPSQNSTTFKARGRGDGGELEVSQVSTGSAVSLC